VTGKEPDRAPAPAQAAWHSLAPAAAAAALGIDITAGLAPAEAARRLGLQPKIAYVCGDDLVPRMKALIAADRLRHFETGEPIKDASAFLTANAYLGCWGIVDALSRGADIVITGRCTDAAVVCGPAAWHHGWSRTDWNALAGAVVAGAVAAGFSPRSARASVRPGEGLCRHCGTMPGRRGGDNVPQPSTIKIRVSGIL
jgi:hypothetical protein